MHCGKILAGADESNEGRSEGDIVGFEAGNLPVILGVNIRSDKVFALREISCQINRYRLLGNKRGYVLAGFPSAGQIAS